MILTSIDWEAVNELDGITRKAYLVLVEALGAKEFSADDIELILQRNKIAIKNINKFLSTLVNAKLAKEIKSSTDMKSSYKLILKTQKNVPKRSIGKDDLIRLLKSGADLIRTAVDYKILLLLLFYKTISDKWHSIVDGYIKEGFSLNESYILANSEYLNLYDETEGKLYSWHETTQNRDTIKELANAMIKISKMNQKLNDFQKLVEILGLLGFVSSDNMHTLEGLVELFNQYDFSEVNYDTIGDAYQWVLYYFAPLKAKEGETYTPREVIKLIIRILDIEDGSLVLDPACGSGTMLIESHNYVRDVKLKGKEPNIELLGQERNEIMAIIAKMNLILHGIENYKIFVGDSLTNPRFKTSDYVIANPPWNQDGYTENNLGDPSIRHIYTSLGISGFTSRNSADWAWVELMIYHANKKVGVILDSGALFRGGREKNIRKTVVEKDLIDTIILLPEKLFYNTGAPGIILILNKNKSSERKNKVLFINASQEYIPHSEIRRLNMLSDENIKHIVEIYNKFENVYGIAKVVSVDEIRENDFNLNVSLYAFPEEIEEEVDIAKELEEFEKIETEEKKAVAKAIEFVKEILKVNQQ